MKIKKYCFDIDGVICNTKINDYKNSKPILKSIKKINYLYEKGHKIIIFTARYMGRSNEKKSLAKKLGYSLTKKQLLKWGVKYDQLIFGKPSYDLFIDDKALFFKKNWHKLLK